MRRIVPSAPFALILNQKNAEHIYALNDVAKHIGLAAGMGLSDARGICPALQTASADLEKDAHFLRALARFSQSYCPWVGLDGLDGLVLDLTGSVHLWGGETGFIKKAKVDFSRFGLSVKIGIAPTRGAAWALAHFQEGIAEDCHEALSALPIAALRIDAADELLARRFGLCKISDLYGTPRAEIARRFSADFLTRRDQALGEQFESISPIGAPRNFAVRMNFPEPIGLTSDVMAGFTRLLTSLESKLANHGQSMQELQVGLRMSDGKWHQLCVGFARPMRRTSEILRILEPKISDLDAGFGFDLLRAEAKRLSACRSEHIGGIDGGHAFDDLLSKIGNRIGFENIRKIVARESHWPEKSVEYVRFDDPKGAHVFTLRPRPLLLFPPERLAGRSQELPSNFTWRRMKFRTARAIGPERIAPEWWCEEADWKFGIRDYWRVATREGRRLWMFHTPQSPAWYVHGEFA